MAAGKYLTFQLGKEAYGIGIMKVQEIVGVMPVTRMPKLPHFVRGLVNLRGKVIPVFDLRLKFGLERKEDTDRTCIIVVRLSLDGNGADASEVTLGIIVDEVSEVVNVPADAIEPAPAFGSSVDVSFLLGVGKLGNKVVMLLDADRILPREELQSVTQEAAVAA
ncbi:MAG: purine-binding chemotaxis protein CheW [Fibrobacteres bacterium]|jgi:purine-binding chemotaxis protein CheW|nr:purine-binding chemotaxis protein CheW [Fibrobacterota bacterium]